MIPPVGVDQVGWSWPAVATLNEASVVAELRAASCWKVAQSCEEGAAVAMATVPVRTPDTITRQATTAHHRPRAGNRSLALARGHSGSTASVRHADGSDHGVVRVSWESWG